MNAIEQADHFQQKADRYHDESKSALQEAAELQLLAIELLLSERKRIDERLVQLGHGDKKAALGKKRGRPSKRPEISSHSETTRSGASLSGLEVAS